MGLAAPRKKTKISHDPNNTNWSRSTSGFGHKILSSQGWTPGSFLGARNAAHADMFTAASASHIRVVVKDDTLGLGARSKRDPLDEPTGLDAFKGLLGRLNGKSDAELEADQRKRDDVKLARYAATKWQAVRFVSGGLLAQEKDDESRSKVTEKPLNDVQKATDATGKEGKKADSIDRGHTEQGVDNETAFDERENSKSRERRDKKDKDKTKRREKKEKKDKKDKKEKREKKERKEKKRKRAEQPEESDTSSSPEQSSGHEESASKKQDTSANLSMAKERRPVGRTMIRGRYIAQKRKALMDEKSLNEIFMVKS
ncbi:hypothetical protein BDV18DRAFT_11469 [Aspergillus unguis]